ncbi:P1 family peptidase [Nakamurella sp. A5-74]|uniref:P1 family peptidase n=1 Tax=Nakamurella sp. A5-74 TaxID=3158264 RepID=A0AAU8DIQ1_9ACTN
MSTGRLGATNRFVDVAGIQVGHHTAVGDGWLTGTTVILAPPGGMTAGVDVRGGGPGTRETDLLDPVASMERIDAIVLTGGSAFGLAAASGAAEELADLGRGFPLGSAPDEVVPIVPAAVLFDLGRGGRFRATPGEEFGRLAVRDALRGDAAELGSIGAGTGAVAAHLKGGLGSASQLVCGKYTVSALIAVNAVGSPVDPITGQLSGTSRLLVGDGTDLGVSLSSPEPTEVPDVVAWGRPRRPVPNADPNAQAIQNTTIGVVATDARLSKVLCTKMASMSHDGLARSLDPIHTMFDGDSMFGISTGAHEVTDVEELHEILCAAATVTTRAVTRAMLSARTTETTAGRWPGYLDLAPSLELKR